MDTTIDIPITTPGAFDAPTPDLAGYGPGSRTFIYAGPAGSNCRIEMSADGTLWSGACRTVSPGERIVVDERVRRYRAELLPASTAAQPAGTLTVTIGPDPSAPSGTGPINTLVLGNFPVGGVIGTAPLTVDAYGAISIAQTTAGQVLTFPAPTNASPTLVRWVNNIGTQSFALYGLTVLAGASTKVVWNGSAWVEGCTGTSTPTRTLVGAGGARILDATAAASTLYAASGAVFTSDGSTTQVSAGAGDLVLGAFGGKVQVFANVAGGAIEIDTNGPAGAGDITIGGTTGTVKNVNIGSIAGASSVAIVAGTGGVGVGTNPIAHTVTIGNITGASAVAVLAGTGGIGMAATGAGVLTMASGATGSATFDSGGTGDVDLGTGAAAKRVRVGTTTAGSSLVLRSGGAITIAAPSLTLTWPTVAPAAGMTSVLTTDAAGNAAWAPDLDRVAAWSAEASLVNAAAQFIPNAGAASSLTAVSGALMTGAGTLRSFLVNFTGNAANAAQTVVFELLKNGASTVPATVTTAIATTAGVKSQSVSVAAAAGGFVAGDIYTVKLTPSAALGGTLSLVTAAVGL